MGCCPEVNRIFPAGPEPEAPRKLAGGANHRNPTHNGYAPAGAAELNEALIA